MSEQWRDIPGFEGRYQASDLGRVRSLDRYVRSVAKNGRESMRRVVGRVLAPQRHSSGYLQVSLSGRTRIVGVCVLVAFIGPRPADMQCAHNDGDKRSNCLSNLRWATPLANSNDRRTHGTSGRGAANAGAKLTAGQVAAIRRDARVQRLVAQEHGIRQSTVSKIKLGQRWA